jgi:hypothetical protein
MLQESLKHHGAAGQVRVVWDKRFQRFEIQTFGHVSKRWNYASVWGRTTKTGGWICFRAPVSAKPILEYLSSIDASRFGDTAVQVNRRVMQELGNRRAAHVAKMRAMRADILSHAAKEDAKLASGAKLVIGPGGPRKRDHWMETSSEATQSHAEYQKAMEG